jgi:tetratricopeptide (TPR) repeat protein
VSSVSSVANVRDQRKMLTNVILFLIATLLTQQTATAEQEIQRIAMEGWTAARALAPKGGAVELLGPVNLRLRALDKYPHTSARYAETAIRAAVSAAQEERDELRLFLDHARDLSRQMAVAGAPALWPLPIDELAGELWLEVDFFKEAREAYESAIKIKPTPNAWIGLARASDRLGDTAAACRAYAQAGATPGLPNSVELEISLYALKCRF